MFIVLVDGDLDREGEREIASVVMWNGDTKFIFKIYKVFKWSNSSFTFFTFDFLS